MYYLILTMSIVAEVIGTTCLKLAQSSQGWFIGVALGYGVSFYLLGLALKVIPLGIAYAMWSGVGTALITLVGFLYFQQRLSLWHVAGIGLIIAGVILLRFAPPSA